MSNRTFYIAFGGVLLIVLLFIARNAVSDPLEDRRAWLNQRLNQMAETPSATLASDEIQHLAWERTIVGSKSAWTDLVPPPPPPKPKKKAPPKPPNVVAMLNEVFVTRMQIGDKKVKVVHPNAPNGEWLSPGMKITVPMKDKSETLTFESFDRSTATFSYLWQAKGQVLKGTIPRE
jgi:hypothetical protein